MKQTPPLIEYAQMSEQNEPDDILGNQSILKQITKPGEPNTRPERNSLATISYKLYLVDDSTTRLIETVTNESFFIGEYDVLTAIDMSVQLMDRGEQAVIDSDSRHCYDQAGCEEKQIPPITSENPYRMKIELDFHDWKAPPEISTMKIDERIFWSDKKRQRGNFCYRRKQYTIALHCYQTALKFVDTETNPLLEEDENQSSSLTERYIQIQNNLAQVYLSNSQHEQCLDAVNSVLKFDINNIKALFRQAKALIDLGNYDHAIQPLKLLLQNPSQEVERDIVREMLNLCETKLAKYRQTEKEVYKRMFQSKSNEQKQTKTDDKTNNRSLFAWWTYAAMGGAALAAVGIAAALKYN